MLLENLEFELTFSCTAHVAVEMSEQFTNCKTQILCNKVFYKKKSYTAQPSIYANERDFYFSISHTVLCNFATVK